MDPKKFKFNFANRELEIELTDWSEQANGSAIVKYGDTIILATATMGEKPREGIDFFPLLVDYEEKFYAVGKILGGRFIKREAKPSEEAILSARFIDRAIRPLFNDKIRNDVQVVVTVLSLDDKNEPDSLAILSASTALASSNIPWNGPIGAVKIGRIKGKLILNPTFKEKEESDLDLLITGVMSDNNKDVLINMIEVGAKEITESELIEAIEFAKKPIQELINFQKEILKNLKIEKIQPKLKEEDNSLKKKIKEFVDDKLESIIYTDKITRSKKLEELKNNLKEFIEKIYPDDSSKISDAFHYLDDIICELVHRNIIDKEKRPDGRKLEEIRPISCNVGFLPRAHGSGFFARGLTKVLSVLTLGSPNDEQIVEGMEISIKKHFMHHYNFPPYSVGEVAPIKSPGRREIGHGALAEKALSFLIPSKDEFPYTIRVVSEVMSSNGSSSMGSVCAATLALMDGGVPIKKPVSGIAMGLMSFKENSNFIYKILTDIQGPEDHYGDMDFKAAGTKDGLTAIQMDVKIKGVPIKIISETLEKAKKARLEILEKMLKVLSQPRSQISPFAPKIETIQINPEKIRDVIGPQGRTIREIIDKTGTTIDLEENGLVYVTGSEQKFVKKAIKWIKDLTREVKIGDVFKGKITKITDFGAFAEILPNQEGLIHISQLSNRPFKKVSEIVKIGDIVPVKVIGIDELGRINLSLKEVLSKNNHLNFRKRFKFKKMSK